MKMSLPYLPGFFMFCAYNYLHYTEKNWIGYHENSPWARSFLTVDFKGFLKNIVVLGWRLIDFGRIFLWMAGVWLGLKYFSIFRNDKTLKELLIVFLVVLLCSSFSFLTYVGLNAHRYILPVYLTFSLLVIYMVFNSKVMKKTWLAAIIGIGLLSGHLWIYPSHISQGWDASLAHVHYYSLREKVYKDMNTNHISVASVACVFPNNSEQKFMDLSDAEAKHPAFDHKLSKYVLYSNVYNAFTDEDVKVLTEEFKIIIHHQKMGVFMTLYERK